MKIAVLGATGSVGYWILQILAERSRVAPQDVSALASPPSAGKEISFGDTQLRVQDAYTFDFSGTDLLFSAVPAKVAKEIIPKAHEAYTHVIDKSSAFRDDPKVPLVVPEVNGDLLDCKPPLVASPNCVVIPLVLALNPLHQETPIKAIHVSTYQAASGAGRKAMDTLYAETQALLTGGTPANEVFHKQLSCNVLPEIGDLLEDGYTEEEDKIINETRRILGEDIQVTATAVRVPVFVGHALSVVVEFQEPLSRKKAAHLLSGSPGLTLKDRHEFGHAVTPIECVGEDTVFVSRLRQVRQNNNALAFWVTCDNLRKGAALNAVQIGERL